MQLQEDLYNELSYYTLAHSSPDFIHQNIVDAFAAQTADIHTKPIKLTFALMGLYLYLEKGFSGKQVQLAHMKLAKVKNVWPKIVLPEYRGSIAVADVLKANPGKERDEMIHKWCVSVWEAYNESHQKIANYLHDYLI
jgi:hypothetical protein